MIKWLLHILGLDHDHSCVSEMPIGAHNLAPGEHKLAKEKTGPAVIGQSKVVMYVNGQEYEAVRKCEELRNQANSFTMGPEALNESETIGHSYTEEMKNAKWTNIEKREIKELKSQLEEQKARIDELERLHRIQETGFNIIDRMLGDLQEKNKKYDEAFKRIDEKEFGRIVWGHTEAIVGLKIETNFFQMKIDELETNIANLLAYKAECKQSEAKDEEHR